jgi:hypothetical protein
MLTDCIQYLTRCIFKFNVFIVILDLTVGNFGLAEPNNQLAYVQIENLD